LFFIGVKGDGDGSMDEFLIRRTGFGLVFVFFTFVVARTRERMSNGLNTAFKDLSSRYKQERYFIVDNLPGFPQAFLACEETSFVVVHKKRQS
jgi:hypothetical protein